MSPAEISMMDCNRPFGMNLNEGKVCMARNMIVLAIGLNLYQIGNREGILYVSGCGMIKDLVS